MAEAQLEEQGADQSAEHASASAWIKASSAFCGRARSIRFRRSAQVTRSSAAGSLARSKISNLEMTIW
jgi:hypothetical protein